MADFRGFMGSPQSQTMTKQQSDELFCYGVEAYRVGQLAQAYACFCKLPKDNAAAQFNLALCYYMAKNYSKALECCNQALIHLPSGTAPVVSIPVEIETQDHAGSGYQSMMQPYSIEHFPLQCRIQVERVMADCYDETGQEEALKPLCEKLKAKHYGNIDEICQRRGY